MPPTNTYLLDRLESRLLYAAAAGRVPWDVAALTSPAAVVTAAAAAGAGSSNSAFAVAAAADPAPVGPALRVDQPTLYLTDVVDGKVSQADELKLTNAGSANLVIQPGGATFVGADAGQFRADLGSYALVIEPGESATIRVRMSATKVGVSTATLRLVSNDASGAPTDVAVRGLGTAGGTKGPTPQQVLDVYGIPVTVARPSAAVGGTLAGERAMQLLTKADPGPVTVQVLGLTAAGSISGEVVRLGYYAPPASGAPAASAMKAIALVNSIDAVSVSPTAYLDKQFDPGGDAFGVYAEWGALLNRNSWSQDALNTWDANLAARRKVRFYGLKTATGAVDPNAYVMTAESSSADGAATRTVVTILRNVRPASLPVGWGANEVGTANVAGRTSVSGGTYTVAGGGADVGGTADGFHYAYRTLRGDGEIVARVSKLDNTNTLARAGVMVRESLAAGSRHAFMEVTPGGGAIFQSRSATGGATTAVATAKLVAPYWVKIVRAGSVLTGYRSADGKTWTKQGSVTVALGQDAYVGLAVTSHDNAKLATATFDNVSVTPALAANRPAVAPLVAAVTAAAGGVISVRAQPGDASTSAKLLVDGVYVGAAQNGAGPYSFTYDTRVAVDGAHALAVETTDRFGNVARSAVTLTVSNPDLPPIVRVAGVATGAQVTGAAVALTADATDERSVVGVRYYVDGNPIGPEVTAAPYKQTWATAGLAGGWHSLTAVARDSAGHTAESTAVRIWVPTAVAAVADAVTDAKIEVRRNETSPWLPYAGEVLPAGYRAAAAPLSKYGGDTSMQLGATGSFRVQKVAGRWWMVDPDGYAYFDNAVVGVAPKTAANNQAAFNAKFGTGAAGQQAWARWAKAWLQNVGSFTSSWGNPTLLKQAGAQMNYNLVLNLMGGFGDSIGTTLPGTGHTKYQNDAMPVFDPRFVTYCNNYFANVFPAAFPGFTPKGDPYLVGYMTDNELPWASATLDNYLTLPVGDANRNAAEAWLQARGVTAPDDADRTAFKSYVADTYFRVTSSAVRAYDAKHMILGPRFLAGDGVQPYLLAAAKPYIDVASVNYYDDLDPGAAIGPAAAAADLPFTVTEMYAKGVDSGLPNRAGYGFTVRTQAERGAYYQSMALSVMRSDYGVGVAWLSLMDNNAGAATTDTSNADANKGLMPITYPDHAANPYKALTDRMRDVNANLYTLIRGLSAGPAVSPPDLDAASDTGVSDSDNVTNDSTPTFSGTAVPGGLVELLAGDTVVATGSADPQGAYSLTASALADGTYAFRVRVTAEATGRSNTSSALPVTIDTVRPKATIRPGVRTPPTANLDGFEVAFAADVAGGAAEAVFGVSAAGFTLTKDGGDGLDLITGQFTVAPGAGTPAGSILLLSGLGVYLQGDGTYTLHLPDGAGTDLAGNPIVGGTGSDAFAAPTYVSITATAATGAEPSVRRDDDDHLRRGDDGGGSASRSAENDDDEGRAAVPLVFTITRSGDTASPLTVNLGWDATAKATDAVADFGFSDTAITIPAGESSATITLTPLADHLVEGTETARLRVIAGDGYLPNPAATVAEGTVADADVPFAATFTPVAPDPRQVPVDAVTVTFNRAAVGVDATDFTLTRGGAAVPLAGVTIVAVNDATYQLVGLSSVTTAVGAYELRLAKGAAAPQDAYGNPLSADGVETWTTVPPPPPPATTVSLRSPADTYVQDGTFAGTNFGSSVELQVRKSSIANNQREAYLQFDLSQVGSAAGIKSAVIRLYGKLSAAGSVPVGIYSVATNTWTETGIKWSTKPSSGSTALATKTVASTTAAWFEFDVTAYLKAQKTAGATIVGFALKATDFTTPWATFASDEATGNRPELRVTQ